MKSSDVTEDTTFSTRKRLSIYLTNIFKNLDGDGTSLSLWSSVCSLSSYERPVLSTFRSSNSDKKKTRKQAKFFKEKNHSFLEHKCFSFSSKFAFYRDSARYVSCFLFLPAILLEENKKWERWKRSRKKRKLRFRWVKFSVDNLWRRKHSNLSRQ